MNMMNACNVSVELTVMNVPAFTLFIPCMFYAFLPRFMEAGILLWGQNASDLVFSPFEIRMGKEEGGNRKRVVEQGRLWVFYTPGSTCGKQRAEAEKCRKILRQS